MTSEECVESGGTTNKPSVSFSSDITLYNFLVFNWGQRRKGTGIVWGTRWKVL